MSGGWQPAPKYEQIVALSFSPSQPNVAPPGVLGPAGADEIVWLASGAVACAFCFACSSAAAPIGDRSFSIAGLVEAAPSATCGSDDRSMVTAAPLAFAFTCVAD